MAIVFLSRAGHLVRLFHYIQTVHQDHPRHLATLLHPCVADNFIEKVIGLI